MKTNQFSRDIDYLEESKGPKRKTSDMLDSENIQFYNDGEDSDEDEFADSNNEMHGYEEESSNNA